MPVRQLVVTISNSVGLLELYNLKKEETFILEDSRNGIIAADAAGIDVIGVPDLVDISDMTQSHLLCIKENLLKVLDLIK